MSDVLSVHIKKIINYTGWPEGFTHVALQGGSTDNANLYFFTGKPETETYEYRGYRWFRVSDGHLEHVNSDTVIHKIYHSVAVSVK